MPRKTAVMLVDLQRAFDPPPAFVDKVERYSRRFPCRIFTRFINPPGSMFRRLLKAKSCAPGSPEAELLLATTEHDLVFDKVARYGLTEEQVGLLHRRGIQRVTVCGLDTDACVLGVMFSLFDAGIECRLKAEMAWSSTGLHQEALAIAREQFRVSR